MLRPFAALLLSSLLAAAAGCGSDSPASAAGGSRARDGAADAGGAGGPGDQADRPARQVRLARAEAGRLPRTVEVAGTLAADERAELGIKVAGRIQDLAVDLGSPVRRGQVLARIIPTDMELRVRQAETALAQARARLGIPPQGPDRVVDPEETAVVKQAKAVLREAELSRDRAKTLFDEQLIARSDLDAAEAAFQVADARYQDAYEEARSRQAILDQRRSELAIARQALSDSYLRAPFDGAVAERRVALGDYVAVGETVMVLVRVHPLRLRLAVPEREAVGVRVGQPVRLTVEGDPEGATGRVARISPAISEENRTLMVEAEVPNPDGRLKPGAFTRAEIETVAAEPAVLVPASAIASFAGIDKVIGIADGKAVEKRVRVGRREGDRVEILEGLEAGEQVVVEPGNIVEGEPLLVAS